MRFVAITGDAMGMNMLSKATEHALNKFKDIFEDAQVKKNSFMTNCHSRSNFSIVM